MTDPAQLLHCIAIVRLSNTAAAYEEAALDLTRWRNRNLRATIFAVVAACLNLAILLYQWL
jgi:hypothetical protein